MWSHDADPTIVVVKYMEGHVGKTTVSHKEAGIKELNFIKGTDEGAGEDMRRLWPRSGTTATAVTEALQELVKSASTAQFEWNDFTIAFETKDRRWRIGGGDDVELAADMLNAFIFKNTVG
eukprot:GHVU01196118.1.p1 GENE.GHVU01196118.1~~GHVU01196118.1.p1  ORF type:complete len:121 (-),score=16.57 GHVU01196118.1:913-1275(-)